MLPKFPSWRDPVIIAPLVLIAIVGVIAFASFVIQPSTPTTPTGAADTPSPIGVADTPTSPTGATDTPTSPTGATDTPTSLTGATDTPTNPTVVQLSPFEVSTSNVTTVPIPSEISISPDTSIGPTSDALTWELGELFPDLPESYYVISELPIPTTPFGRDNRDAPELLTFNSDDVDVDVEEVWVWIGADNTRPEHRGKQVGRIRVTLSPRTTARTRQPYIRSIPLIVGENIADVNAECGECVESVDDNPPNPNGFRVTDGSGSSRWQNYIIRIKIPAQDRATKIEIEHSGRFTIPSDTPNIRVYGVSVQSRIPPPLPQPPQPVLSVSSDDLIQTYLCLDTDPNYSDRSGRRSDDNVVETYPANFFNVQGTNQQNRIRFADNCGGTVTSTIRTNKQLLIPTTTPAITLTRDVSFLFNRRVAAITTDPTSQIAHTGQIKLRFSVPTTTDDKVVAIHIAIAARNLCVYEGDDRAVRSGDIVGRIEPTFKDGSDNTFILHDLFLRVGENIRQARVEPDGNCVENSTIQRANDDQNNLMYVRDGEQRVRFNQQNSPEGAGELRIDVVTIVIPPHLRKLILSEIVIYDDYDLNRRNDGASMDDRTLTHDPFLIIYGITLDTIRLEESYETDR